MDLGFSGHPFTWNTCRFGSEFICERLDRALANEDWCTRFQTPLVFQITF